MHALLEIWSPPKWEAIEAVGTWVAAIGTLLAVVVALWLAQRDVRARRTERRGEIIAMITEVYRAGVSMRALLKENIQAPLYRMPIANFNRALPKFITDGRLDIDDIGTLVDYGNRMEELNRGLERAGDAHAAGVGGMGLLAQEFQRNMAKAREILEAKSNRYDDQTLLDATEVALLRLNRVYASWWGRVKLWWRDSK
jgi:hypothetical protein